MAQKRKMIAHSKYHYKKKSGDNTIEMDVNLSRFEKQYGKAQYLLDSMVMDNMVPYMPMQTGTFIQVTRGLSAAIAGSGYVYAAAPPMGRYLYEGKTMVDEKTGSPWARKGARKVLVSQYKGKTNAKENLEYSRSAHPNATAHWFDATKQACQQKWIKKTKKTAGGG